VTQGVFGRDYAAAYDELYQDKDYLAECDLIENVFNLYGQSAIRRVLDEHEQGRHNHRLLIWSLLCFEWWCRIFLNREPVPGLT